MLGSEEEIPEEIEGIRVNHVSDGLLIADRCEVMFNTAADQCVARYLKGKMLGGVVFNTWTGFNGTINMHVAAWHPRWINRDMLWAAFDYPFNQLQVRSIFGQVPVSNQHAYDFDLKLGFKPVCVIPDVYPDGGGMHVLRMYREDCRFLGPKPSGFKEVDNGW